MIVKWIKLTLIYFKSVGYSNIIIKYFKNVTILHSTKVYHQHIRVFPKFCSCTYLVGY